MKHFNLFILSAMIGLPAIAFGEKTWTAPAVPSKALTLDEAVAASKNGDIYIIDAKTHKFLRNHYLWNSPFSGDVYEANAPYPYDTNTDICDQVRFNIYNENGKYFIHTKCGDLYLSTRVKNTTYSNQDKYGVRVYADDACKPSKQATASYIHSGRQTYECKYEYHSSRYLYHKW